MRVFAPLKGDHPLVSDGMLCAKCHKPFYEGQRPCLIPFPALHNESIVEVMPCHATCVLQGREVAQGKILRIKDGDGSPYPVEVETICGVKQYKLEEVGLSD